MPYSASSQLQLVKGNISREIQTPVGFKVLSDLKKATSNTYKVLLQFYILSSKNLENSNAICKAHFFSMR